MKISILLITYNHQKYIQKAIESILIQKDCTDLEIIVSDDHSTDDTVSIVKSLIGNDKRVSIHSHEKNIGITKNYQYAFSLCKGEYIFILEGDDYWIDPFKLKKQTDFMDLHPFCGMCGHPYFRQREDLSIFTAPKVLQEPYTFYDCKDMILDPSGINNFSVGCYRRSLLERISPETYETISYDWMINISVAQFGQIASINSPMSVYRISSSGAWSGHTEETQLRGIIEIIPTYDRILGYKYTDYFSTKKNLIQKQLDRLLQPAPKTENLLKRQIIRYKRKLKTMLLPG